MGPEAVELIVVEQFIKILPLAGQDWGCRHYLETLMEATHLMDDYLTAQTA